MNKILISGSVMLLSASLSLGASPAKTPTPDPLFQASRYSLEIADDGKTSSNYFPIGILGASWDQLPFLGMNLSEAGHCCYDIPAGKCCSHNRPVVEWKGRGKLFMNIWAAHTLYHSRKTKKYGELKNRVNGDGSIAGRHDLSFADPATRKYVLECAAISARQNVKYDSANIGIWGIDNEYELGPDYSPRSIALFRAWLEKIYQGDLKKFQKAWGDDSLAFAEANPPKIEERELRPGPWLDWRRFSEGFFADFLREYFATIQGVDPLRRPVVAKNTQCTLEMQAVVRNRAINHERIAEVTRDLSQGWYGFDQYGHGDRSNYEMNYFYNCILPKNPEPGKRYGGFAGENNNHAGPGWQFAQTYFRQMANGLRGGEFFCMGGNGAIGDWATFSFLYPDGTPRDRLFYASRFASMIHRTEKLWTQGRAVAGLPKVAMLLPQRDILLSRDTGVSWWDFSTNNRLNVYSRLREAGFWVDVLPYGKLNKELLNHYQALILINAEHLTEQECKTIENYVRAGGVLLADMLAGKYDEHHIEHNGLETLLGVVFRGVYTGIEVSPDDLWYQTPYGNLIRADGKILADLTSARLLNQRDVTRNAKGAWITENQFGKGKAFWFNTRLGALRPESAGNDVIADWFAERMRAGNVFPAYTTNLPDQGNLRVEIPISDLEGNTVIAVSGTTYKPLPAFQLSVMAAKEPDFRSAWWLSAESNMLEPLPFSKAPSGKLTFQMPSIRSAGLIYLLPAHAPVLGMQVSGAKESAENDPYTALFAPGDTFSVTVRVVNPSNKRSSENMIHLEALQDWTVSEAQAVAPLASGESRDYTFQVTSPKKSAALRPNLLYPLVATLKQNDRRIAVTNSVVMLKLGPGNYDYLLSENRNFGKRRYEFTLKTNAQYHYELPAGGYIQDPSTTPIGGATGKALTTGLNWWKNIVKICAPEANIIFDLKKDYCLSKIELRYHGEGAPSSLEILASKDGKAYYPIEKIDSPKWNDRWLTLNLEQKTGRYVKIHLKFPNKHGGWIDEVALWGRTLEEKIEK